VTPTLVATDFTGAYPMTEPRETDGASTVTVRMDSELVRLARIVCAGREIKLVDYLDALTREKILADYEAFMGQRSTPGATSRPQKKKRGAKGEDK
jgi:hypothetical protein